MGPSAADSCDVCVIGAGWSGLLAARHLVENGLSVVILERREGLGGVWRHTHDPNIVSVMETTVTSSSAAVTEASDFPMDVEIGNFVDHRDILDYLERYARHFDLLRRIRFGRDVSSVRRGDGADGRWQIDTNAGSVSSRFVVVASGRNQRLRGAPPQLAQFAGQLQLAGQLKRVQPDDYPEGANVLVYGGGETASDVVEQLVQSDARVTWAIPNGQHFFRKAPYQDRDPPAPGAYDKMDSPLDEASSRFIQLVSPFHRSKPGMKWLCVLGSTGSVLDFEGHGIPQWHKGVPFMSAFVNKNGHVVEFVKSGRVHARAQVMSTEGHLVQFEDGHSERFSHVILCTGYLAEFSFLPAPMSARDPEDLYKLTFEVDDPTLAFIGLVRPNVGSIPMMAEPQCFYVARVFAGLASLPSRAEMSASVTSDRAARDEYFRGHSRPSGLVHCFEYGYDVAELAGVRPNYLRLFLRSPRAWWKTFFAPANAAQFRLMDPRTRDAAVAQIWRRQRAKYFLFPFVYAISRLLFVDFIVDLLQLCARSRRTPSVPADHGPLAERQTPQAK